MPTVALASESVSSDNGGGATTMVNCREACCAEPSATRAVKVNVPAVVEVPVIAPAVDKLNPVGRAPAVMVQVLENLVSNAVKYSPPGKNIFVRLKRLPAAARCEVQDEGPGLSAEDQKKLFGKFARLSAKPTGGEHSTGLGLSIVKKMVEAMKGQVWCESEPGKGATFIVSLPASVEGTGSVTNATASLAVSGG